MPFELVAFCKTEARGIAQVSFSPDGKVLAAAEWNPGRVSFWDTTNWQQTEIFLQDEAWYGGVAFAPDGKYLATCDSGATCNSDGNVKIWEIELKRLVREIKVSHPGICHLQYSPDANQMISRNHLWDMHTGNLIRELESNAIFHPTQPVLVIVSTQGIEFQEINTGMVLRTLPDSEGETLLALSPDGKTFITQVPIGRTKYRNTENENQFDWFTPDWPACDSPAAISPDGKWLVGVDAAETIITIWSLADKRLSQTFQSELDYLTALVFSPSGEYFVCCGGGIWGRGLEVYCQF